jgi:hypothetical protein
VPVILRESCRNDNLTAAIKVLQPNWFPYGPACNHAAKIQCRTRTERSLFRRAPASGFAWRTYCSVGVRPQTETALLVQQRLGGPGLRSRGPTQLR